MYNKLYTKILDSSIWLEPNPTRIVWITFLAAMDEDGFAQFSSVRNLANRAMVTVEEAIAAVQTLESPDRESANKEHDGRRIERVDGGWMILNAGLYRDIVTRTEKLRLNRERVARHRAKKSGNAVGNAPVMQSYAVSESEAVSESDKKVPTEPVPQKRDCDGIQTVFDHWKLVHGHPRAQLDAKRRRIIRAALANYTADQLCEAISGYQNSPHHMGVNDRGTRYDDIGLFLRDASHIDAGIAFATDPPKNVSSLTRRNIAAVEDWVPPEMRNATN